MSIRCRLSVWVILLLQMHAAHAQYHYNRAGQFNGTSSHIAVVPLGLTITGSFTVECWVNPAALSQGTILQKAPPVNAQGFSVFLNASGRITIRTNAVTRLVAKTSLETNRWTHVAGTYHSATNIFSIYLDGSLDTSATVPSAAPISTNDTLFIGTGNTGFYSGMLDEVRLWNIARTGSAIARDMYIPLATVLQSSGPYVGLLLACRLNGNGINDALNTNGFARNMSWVDLRQKAVNHVDYNGTLSLDGVTGYCAAPPDGRLDATSAITLEAWIRRDTSGTQPSSGNIVNKSGGTNRYNYALWVSSTGSLTFHINAPSLSFVSTPSLITAEHWTHVAATYNASTGRATLYVNGDSAAGTTFSGNPSIQNNPDSLFIGGIGASNFTANKFKGQIDQVRIWKDIARTSDEIKQNMYRSIDNATLPVPAGVVVWGFDGINKDEVALTPGYALHFRNTALMTSAHRQVDALSVSPLLRDDVGGFGGPTYATSTRRFAVPDTSLTGIVDSVYVSAGGAVTDIRAFVLMNHTRVGYLTVTLANPSGVSVTLLDGHGGGNNDVMTIFSDAADSLPGPTTLSGFRPPFSPMVKPANPLSAFVGLPRQGWWKIRFADAGLGWNGYVSGWGVQTSPLTDVTIASEIPGAFVLHQNYPNPFNPSTTIRYTVPGRSAVVLHVYDIIGRHVATLVDKVQDAGGHIVTWNAAHVASGVYFYRLTAAGSTAVKRMLVVK